MSCPRFLIGIGIKSRALGFNKNCMYNQFTSVFDRMPKISAHCKVMICKTVYS